MPTVGSLIVVLSADSAKFEAAMGRARRSTSETQAAIKRLEREGLDRMTAGMTVAGSSWQQGMQRISAANRVGEAAMQRTVQAVNQLPPGFRKVENAIINMGLGMVGLQGKAGKLSEGLLMMGLGGPVLLALTAGLAIGGAAYRYFTRDVEKAREEQEKFAEQTRQAAASRLRRDNPVEGFRSELLALSTEAAKLNRDLDRAKQGRTTTDAKTGLSTTVVDPAAIRRAQQALDDFRIRATEVSHQFIDAMDEMAKRNTKAVDKITYDWSRVRNVFMDEALDRVTRQREQAFERRMREIEEMFSSPTRLKLDVPTGDEIFRDVETSAARVASSTGAATLKAIEQTAVARQLRMAEFVKETWLSAARNIQSAMADTFMGIFEGQIRSLNDFARSVVNIVQRSIAEILAAQATAGLAPVLRGVFGAASGAATGGAGVAGTGPNGWGGSALRAQPANIVQNIVYAPQVTAIDSQDTARFFRRHRGQLLAEVARGVQGSAAAAAAMRG